MKHVKFTLFTGMIVLAAGLSACKKCHDCHYDKDGQEIEIGKFCDKDEINDLETNGYTVDSVNYEVHCHEH